MCHIAILLSVTNRLAVSTAYNILLLPGLLLMCRRTVDTRVTNLRISFNSGTFLISFHVWKPSNVLITSKAMKLDKPMHLNW